MTETCVRCGARFVVMERHPAVTNDQWCPACLPIVWAESVEQLRDPSGRGFVRVVIAEVTT